MSTTKIDHSPPNTLPLLTLSASAKDALWDIMTPLGGPDAVYLRVYIVGGGCSGFQYNFELENAPQEDDVHIHISHNTATFRLLVDSMSIAYLQNATIDHKKDLEGERFLVHNPNAKTTCGCGNSFSID